MMAADNLHLADFDPELAALLAGLFGRDSDEMVEAASRIRDLEGVPTETFKALLTRCPAWMVMNILRDKEFLSARQQADLQAGKPPPFFVNASTESLKRMPEEAVNKLLSNCTVKIALKGH